MSTISYLEKKKQGGLLSVETALFVPLNLQSMMLPMVIEQERFVRNNVWLCRMCKDLGVETIPIVHTALQGVIPEIYQELSDANFLEKVHFSLSEESKIMERLSETNKKQIILSGMEVHVCVLQTAIELVDLGYEVYVVKDAVTARNRDDIETALRRLENYGISLITKEMVMFEAMRRTETVLYKKISEKYFKG